MYKELNNYTCKEHPRTEKGDHTSLTITSLKLNELKIRKFTVSVKPTSEISDKHLDQHKRALKNLRHFRSMVRRMGDNLQHVLIYREVKENMAKIAFANCINSDIAKFTCYKHTCLKVIEKIKNDEEKNKKI